MNLAETSLGKSVKLIRLVGYVLLTLSIFDAIALLVPPGFMNPIWELQVMSQLVDAVPVPLIGLVMIFFAEQSDRLRLEKRTLRFLSWACLVMAVFHFGLLPLGLGNTWRVNNRNNTQISAALSQQTSALINVETRLNQTDSAAELQKIISGLVRANPDNPPNINDPKLVRQRMLSEISATTKKIKADSEAARSNTLQNLIKTSIKLNLGTLAAAIAYFFLWKLTPWARITSKRKSRRSEAKEPSPENSA
jgi:hypothetical protein